MRLLCLLALLSVAALADTYEKRRVTVYGHTTVSTTYRKGDDYRSEDENGRVYITTQHGKVTYLLDLKSAEYMQPQPGLFGFFFSLANMIQKPREVKQSGKTVNVYYEAIDMQESQMMFGQVARHVIVKMRQVAEPGACQLSYSTETDGWYIPSQLPAKRGYVMALSGGRDAICRDHIVFHGNPGPWAVAVKEHREHYDSEMLEYSTAALDPSLFEIPAHFRKVDALPGMDVGSLSQEFEMGMRQLENAVQSWF